MLLYTNRDIVVDRFLNEISHNLGEKEKIEEKSKNNHWKAGEREREREVS
jgi:hypothetical protein